MLLTVSAIVLVLGILLLRLANRPARLIYLVPLLLAFEYRAQLGSFSIDLAELSVLVVLLVYLAHRWDGKQTTSAKSISRDGLAIFLLAICAFPSILFETNFHHAASVYRDLLLPFFFFFVFVRIGLEREQIDALIKVACVLALANAGLGMVQCFTGNHMWFAGPDEAEWQAYKTGLAKLSIFGRLLGARDTLPVGLYTGANNFACYLSTPLCLFTMLAFCRELTKVQRLASFVATSILLACLFFTIFRSGLLVYAVSMMLLNLLLSSRKSAERFFVAGMLAGALALAFLTEGLFDWDQFGSFAGREQMISASWALIKAHPELLLTGGFTDLYHLQSRETQEIHNLFLYSVVHFGLPATLLFYTFFARLLWCAVSIAKHASGLHRDVLAAVAVSVGCNIFLYGATTMLIDSVQTSIWLLFWTGIAAYLALFLKYETVPGPSFALQERHVFPAGAEVAGAEGA